MVSVSSSKVFASLALIIAASAVTSSWARPSSFRVTPIPYMHPEPNGQHDNHIPPHHPEHHERQVRSPQYKPKYEANRHTERRFNKRGAPAAGQEPEVARSMGESSHAEVPLAQRQSADKMSMQDFVFGLMPFIKTPAPPTV